MHGSRGTHIRRTHLQEFLLKGQLLLPPRGLLVGGWQAEIRTSIVTRPLVKRFELGKPVVQRRIIGILFGEVMPIAQQMHPTALMQSLINVVGGVEVTAQDRKSTRLNSSHSQISYA